jgi:uncharacterized RDD family membrane protein YckC
LQLDPPDLPPLPPAQPKLAALLRRIASIGYEALLLVPVLFVSSYLFLSLTQSAQGPLKRPLFQLWVVGVMAIYFIYCWLHGGQTLAMKTWRIRVARADGEPLRLSQAAARFLAALWGVFLLGITFWWAFIDRDRQFLHDRLCGTRLFTHRIVPPRAANRE